MNIHLKDEIEIRNAIEKATKGLSQLNMYSNLSAQPGSWAVQLDSNPMPRPDGK